MLLGSGAAVKNPSSPLLGGAGCDPDDDTVCIEGCSLEIRLVSAGFVNGVSIFCD